MLRIKGFKIVDMRDFGASVALAINWKVHESDRLK